MKKTMFALASGLLLTGCVVTSVHPFYSRKDVSFEPSLVGQWTNTQSNESWSFAKQESDAYHLIYVSDGKTNLATAHFFKLNSQSFLDFVSADSECEVLPPPVPSHLLLRVTKISPTLRLAPLNHDWLKGLIEKNPKILHHEWVDGKADDGRVVLTGETEELQQFLSKNLNSEDAWKDSFELQRADRH